MVNKNPRILKSINMRRIFYNVVVNDKRTRLNRRYIGRFETKKEAENYIKRMK